MEWKFEREEQKFEEVPVGEHRCRIKEVEKAVSKNGNDMLVIKLEISGYSSLVWHYVVFMADRPEMTNRMLTQIFDSFGIEDGDFNLESWKGKAGGVVIKHDDEDRAKVSYFLNKKKQENLPEWKSPENAKLTPVADIKDSDLPF